MERLQNHSVNEIQISAGGIAEDVDAFSDTVLLDIYTQGGVGDSFLRDTKVSGDSDAFNVEYREFTDKELRDDLVSYIGEYRLQVQKFDYELDYYADTPFTIGEVRDVNKGESMREKAKRSVLKRKEKGEPTHREEREEQAFGLLNGQLAVSREGDTIFWASPPGPKEEGYGSYGFLFQGKVKDIGLRNGQQHKRLSMTAIRVEDPTIQQYNRAMSELTGVTWNMESVDDFLGTPVVVNQVEAYTVDHILQKNFSFQMDESEREMTAQIMQLLDPIIDDCISVFRSGTKIEKLQALHVLENYALELKATYKQGDLDTETLRLKDIVDAFGYEPPKVGGSCGSSSTTNPLTSGYETLLSALGLESLKELLESTLFSCPKCPFITDKPVGDACPGCGLTKEQFAKQGGEVC